MLAAGGRRGRGRVRLSESADEHGSRGSGMHERDVCTVA